MTNQIFRLSCALEGHNQDVKAVAVIDENTFASASRDTKVLIWQRVGNRFEITGAFHGHSHFVNSLVYMPSKRLLFSAGNDRVIYAFDPQNPGQYVLKMEGHSENICALSVGKLDTIISGSWDKTAKVWKDGKCIQTLQGHSYAVWGVLQLDNGMIATASADRTIILWNNGVQFKVLTGHTDVVRTIVNIPNLGFASCSNDGTIRIWDNSGSSLYELHGHTSFVYSITVLPTGELVSSGEDRSARVWSGKAEIQTITLPCVSVWSVSSLPNGDFVVGGSDAIVRVFTRTEERLATEDELHVFQSSLAAAKVPVNQVGDLDTKKLGGIEVLTVPGKKEGEVKMLRIGDKVSAYQWSSADTTWVEIGEVTDAVGSNRKQIYQGKEYDYVFDVDIQEGAPPLKLPFNSNQNPFEAAQEFIDKNELPQSYLDQIGNFIIANAQNVVLGSAPVSSGGDPWSRGESSSASTNDRKSPLIPQQEFAKLKTIKTAPVLQKIKQINQEFNNGELPLSDSELVILDKIITAIDTNGIKATIGETEWNILSKICYSWPVEKCFPGLDVLRVVVAESSIPVAQPEFLNFERFFDFKNTAEQLLQTNAMLICRVLANSFPHKLKTTELQQTCFNVFKNMEIIGIAKIVGNKNLSIALSTLLLKYRILISLVISFGSIGTSSNNLDILLVWYSQLLGQTKDNEILLRLLAGAGTLILQQPTAKSCLNIAILKQTLQSLPQSSVYDIKLAQNHLKSMI